LKNESKTAEAGRRLMEGSQARLAEHQPVSVMTQDDSLRVETPEADPVLTRLDRIELARADIAERIERIGQRNRVLD
jgi:DNA-binding TFAR19-related protein (PDSD5 family)